MRDNVVIVGTAETTRDNARQFYGKDNYEIWGLNQLYKTMPDITKHATGWFQLHKRERWLERDPDHIEWMQKATFPIWMSRVHDDIPSSARYPLEDVLGMFRRYFNNTLSFMMALAIMNDAKKIFIYGADMASSHEYYGQRPSLEYFIGLAEGRGIDVMIPPDCDLLKAGELYGFEDTNQFFEKAKTHQKWLQDKINRCKTDMLKLRDEEMTIRGALGNVATTEEEKKTQEEVGLKRIAWLQEKQLEIRDHLNQYTGQQQAWEYQGKCWGHS